MHAREDKMAQHIVYCLGSSNLIFLHGFLVQVLLPFAGTVTYSREMRFQLSYVRLCPSVCQSAVTGRIRVKFYVLDFY
jgi:hypothetical protein